MIGRNGDGMYKTNKKPKKNTILFISQKPIGRDLSKFAVALLDKLKGEKEEYRIIYKLHPAECPSWEEDLPGTVYNAE